MGYRHRAVDERLDALLDAAETRSSCLMPHSANDRDALRRRRDEGILEVSRGMFARAAFWEGQDPAQRALTRARALFDRHPRWTFCRSTSAIAHGLAVPYRLARPIQVAAPSYERLDRAQDVHFVRYTPEDVVFRQGIPFTSLVETLDATIRHATFPTALALLDSAFHKRLVRPGSIEDELEQRARNRTGAATLRRALAFYNPRSENGGESEARAAMIDLGFQVPYLQVSFVDPVEAFRCYRDDYLWVLDDGTLVAGELDGRVKTADSTMLAGRFVAEVDIDERRRESRLTALGLRIMRFSPAMVRDRLAFARLLDAYRIPHSSPAEQMQQAAELRLHQAEMLEELGIRNLLHEQEPSMFEPAYAHPAPSANPADLKATQTQYGSPAQENLRQENLRSEADLSTLPHIHRFPISTPTEAAIAQWDARTHPESQLTSYPVRIRR